MKVSELIVQLASMPQDANVVFWYDGSTVDADSCHLSNGGDVVIDREYGYLYEKENAGKNWVYNTCRWEPK